MHVLGEIPSIKLTRESAMILSRMTERVNSISYVYPILLRRKETICSCLIYWDIRLINLWEGSDTCNLKLYLFKIGRILDENA